VSRGDAERLELACRRQLRDRRGGAERRDERGQAPWQIRVEQVAGNDGVRRVRLRVERGTPCLDRVPAVRPQPGQPEVELHDGGVRVELGELLEPVERTLGPTRERGADLRLERVVLREERGSRRSVATCVQALALCELASLGVPSEAERERERRAALAELGRRGLGGSRGAVVRSDDCHRDDRDRGERDGADEERDSTPGGHCMTIARTSKL
jgi:hypothetical protein